VPKKPEGYSSVSVYLVVDGAQRVIDFLKKTFDATELRRYDMPNGSIMHAEVRIDDTVVMIADGGGAWPAGIPPELPAATVTHDFAAHNRIALIEDLQQRNPQSQCDHAITPARFRAGVSV